jgi:RHS repeat-associated protein
MAFKAAFMTSSEGRFFFIVPLRASGGGEAISYYHGDHLGSSNIITDETGAQVQYCEYTPYGTFARNELANPQTGQPVNHYFTGKELDSTGLYFYAWRYYDPTIGRFCQPDTIIPEPYNPQTLNRYSYCDNNPLNYTDPSGHFAWFIGAIIGAIIGAVTAAVTGQNIWQGALSGAISGVIFNYIGGLQLQGLQHTFAHAAGGALSGGINAAITGGDIGRGALIGGFSAGASEWLGSNIDFLKPVAGSGPQHFLAVL